MKINRIMIAAPASGSGKTLITCGLLRLLGRKGLNPYSFKCGPDFIDPMFHTRVLGTRSRNLDTFFTDPGRCRMLLARNSQGAGISVMEGVMGYFDGLGLDSSKASASDLAGITDTPVLLIVPAKGTSRSILPVIKGFLDFQEKPMIKGLILNRVSPMLYPKMKAMIEEELHIPVVGYVPVLTDITLESRHLGLIMPDEIRDLTDQLDRTADVFEKSLDLEQILAIAASAPEIPDAEIASEEERVLWEAGRKLPDAGTSGKRKIRIALARDEAFCFFYADNLDLMTKLGAELVPFSPIHDKKLPEDIDGLWLHGGYPELYGRELSENETMRKQIRTAIEKGLPTVAECGGFLYLHNTLKDGQERVWPMAGLFEEGAYNNGRLTRFGYVTLTKGTFLGQEIGPIPAHEFHYYESENPGDRFLAVKPTGNRSWACVRTKETLYAGFPHLYFYANPKLASAFLTSCKAYRESQS